MHEIDRLLFIDFMPQVPNLTGTADWDNATRLVDLMSFNHIDQPFQVGFYKLSIGKSIPTFTFLPRGGEEIYYRLIVRATFTKTIDELKLF